MSSPTQRTLDRLRKLGWTVDVVEKLVPLHQGDKDAKPVFIRRDLFNCIDIVAVKAGRGILGVQATSATNVTGRVNKARALAALGAWLKSGAKFEVWGWEKRCDRWEPRIVEVLAEDLRSVLITPTRRRRLPNKHDQGQLDFGS